MAGQLGRPIGRAFKELGRTPRKPPPGPRPPREAKLGIAKSLNYARIKIEVMAAVARLDREQQSRIPLAGTLPEIMAALALTWLGYPFQAQRSEDGGRLRLGGAVVDLLVWLGASQVVVRVQGDYLHSLPARKLKDTVQWARLHAKGYRVADIWESDIYRAWVDNRLKQFVDQVLLGAI